MPATVKIEIQRSTRAFHDWMLENGKLDEGQEEWKEDQDEVEGAVQLSGSISIEMLKTLKGQAAEPLFRRPQRSVPLWMKATIETQWEDHKCEREYALQPDGSGVWTGKSRVTPTGESRPADPVFIEWPALPNGHRFAIAFNQVVNRVNQIEAQADKERQAFRDRCAGN